MANNLSLTIGNNTVEVLLPNLTNQQALAVLTRYAKAKGIYDETWTPIQLGEAVLKSMLSDVRDLSKGQHFKEFREQRKAEDDAVLNAENNL